MRIFSLVCLTALLFVSPVLSHAAGADAALASHRWIHGAGDCSINQDPAIEVYEFDQDTYILRQNKCVDYEAPFIYVLFGLHTVLVQDTGATEEADTFPLYETVRGLVEKRQSVRSESLEILVVHSHSHGDHKAADDQFKGMPGVTLIEPDEDGVSGFLASAKTTGSGSVVDLGGRQLTFFPIPGHQDESIALYDSRTKWLLTGDTLYPGIISVLDWGEFVSSIERLFQFTSEHEVSALLGSHIEMSRTPTEVYERGTTFQPDEASLVLSTNVLSEVREALAATQGERTEVVTASVIVRPIPLPVRILIRFLKAVGVG